MWYIESLRPLCERTPDPEAAYAFTIFMFSFLENNIVHAPLELETQLGIIEKSYLLTEKRRTLSVHRYSVILLAAMMVYGKIGNDDHSVPTTSYVPLHEYPLFQRNIISKDWEPTADNLKRYVRWLNRLQIEFLQQINYIIAPNFQRLLQIINNREIFFSLLNAIPRGVTYSKAFGEFIETLSKRYAPRAPKSVITYRMPSGDLKVVFAKSPAVACIGPSPETEVELTPTEISFAFMTPMSILNAQPTEEAALPTPLEQCSKNQNGIVGIMSLATEIVSKIPASSAEPTVARLPSRVSVMKPIPIAVAPRGIDSVITHSKPVVVVASPSVPACRPTQEAYIKQTCAIILSYPLNFHLIEVRAQIQAQSFCSFFRRRNPIVGLVDQLQFIYNQGITLGQKAFIILGILNSNYPELKRGFDLHFSNPDQCLSSSDIMMLFDPKKERLVNELSAALCDLLMDRTVSPIDHFLSLYNRVLHEEIRTVYPMTMGRAVN